MTKPRFATKAAICLGVIIALGAVVLGAQWVLSRSVAVWAAEKDESLGMLAAEDADGGASARPGDGWAPRDGYIQLQLLGSSIPRQEIESIEQDGDKLTVTLEVQDGLMTMDILQTEWRLTGGDIGSIKSVTVDYGRGDVRQVPQCP